MHMEGPYLGEIQLFAFGFAPEGWLRCDGAILEINKNQGLFSLLGNTFGGDGRTVFAVPDLRRARPLKTQKSMCYYIAVQGLYPIRP